MAVIDHEVFDTAENRGVRLASFEIFNVVVTRATGDSSSIFLRTGQELHRHGLIQCPPEIFSTLRQECEFRARSHKRGSEVTLYEIHHEIANTLHLEDRIREMMEAELKEEAASIRAIPWMRETVKEARSRFGRVIFISDTYLPADFLRDRLQALELLQSGDALYASSEHAVRKANGKLFRIVLDKEKIQAGQLLHFGASRKSDLRSAKRLGIGIYHIDLAPHHPSERLLNEHSHQTEGLASMFAGSARLARIEGMRLDTDTRTVWETGACVTGPLVLLYAMWIITRARRSGVRQLYFLARDAYLPYRAVNMLLEHYPQPDLEARYIYGSRHIYNLLGIERLGHDEWTVLTTHGGQPDSTIAELCDSLVVDTAVMESHLSSLGFANLDRERTLTTGEYLAIRDHALENQGFNNAIMDGIRSFQSLAREYFSGEGFDRNKKIAIVDSGWTTRSHAPLLRFLQAEHNDNLLVFCMGVVMPVSAIPLDQIETLLFNRASGEGIMRPSVFYPRAVETLLCAHHGRTVSFQKRDGTIVPIFMKPENGEFMKRFFDAYEGGFSAFMRQMIPHLPGLEIHYDLRGIAEGLIARFWLEPTRNEAAVWSRLEWEWDPQGKVRYPLARPYRLTDAWRAFVQNKFPECQPQFWTGAALRLTEGFNRFVLGKAIALRSGSERLMRLLPSPIQSFMSRAGRRMTRSLWPGF